MSGDTGCAGELMLVSEDTEFAGAPPEPHVVTRMGTDAVLLNDIPDLLFAPVTDGPEAVDMTEGMFAVPKVGFIRLEDCVFSPLRALFSALSGKDKHPFVLETGVVTEGRGADVDLQVGRAPAHPEVRGRLGKPPAGGGLAPFPADPADCAVWSLEEDGGREGVFTEHLPREATFLPLKENGDAEGLPELPAVVGSDLPVEEAWAAPINLLVPEFDPVSRDTVVQKVEETGRGVLSAGEGNDVVVVREKVEVHCF